MKIMLVDDERSLRDILELIIKKSGYDFCYAPDGTTALTVYQAEKPNLVILDVMLPGINGFELCEMLRDISPDVPILMLSAKSDIVDKKIGFNAGADDYLAKPFNEEELLLRIGALLRRKGAIAPGKSVTPLATQKETNTDEITIDTSRCEVTVRGEVMNLTRKEYQIVELLMSHLGAVFTRDDIIKDIWGQEYQSTPISIPTYVRHIREKIELDPSDPKILQTVFGFGYRIKEE